MDDNLIAQTRVEQGSLSYPNRDINAEPSERSLSYPSMPDADFGNPEISAEALSHVEDMGLALTDLPNDISEEQAAGLTGDQMEGLKMQSLCEHGRFAECAEVMHSWLSYSTAPENMHRGVDRFLENPTRDGGTKLINQIFKFARDNRLTPDHPVYEKPKRILNYSSMK